MKPFVKRSLETMKKEKDMKTGMLFGFLGMSTMFGIVRVLAGSAPDVPTKDAPPNAAAQVGVPGPVHRHLARREGEYEIVNKVRKDPNGPVEESTGHSRIRSLLDGRFLLEETNGVMFGQPFAVVRQTGFNNATGRYEATWTYTRSTAMMTLTGQSDDAGRTIRWTGTWNNEQGVRQTLFASSEETGDNQFVLKVYSGPRDGTEFVAVETTYKRRGS